jgi:hypothetical protein
MDGDMRLPTITQHLGRNPTCQRDSGGAGRGVFLYTGG